MPFSATGRRACDRRQLGAGAMVFQATEADALITKLSSTGPRRDRGPQLWLRRASCSRRASGDRSTAAVLFELLPGAGGPPLESSPRMSNIGRAIYGDCLA